jgi:CRISPR-associated DxTHG motif protein
MQELKTKDKLYLDITHGFRYLPMLLLVLSNFAKKTKNIAVSHISYGNFEARSIETKIAPFVDLFPLAEIQEEQSDKINNIKEKYLHVLEQQKKQRCPKILVFGNSKIERKDILAIFKEALNEKQIENFVDIPFLDYEVAKNSNIIEKIDRDKYDYIIA